MNEANPVPGHMPKRADSLESKRERSTVSKAAADRSNTIKTTDF